MNVIMHYLHAMRRYNKNFLLVRIIKIILVVIQSFYFIHFFKLITISLEVSSTIGVLFLYIIALFAIGILFSVLLEVVGTRIEYDMSKLSQTFKELTYSHIEKYSQEELEDPTLFNKVSTTTFYFENINYHLFVPIERILENILKTVIGSASIVLTDFNPMMFFLVIISVIISSSLNKVSVQKQFNDSKVFAKIQRSYDALFSSIDSSKDIDKEYRVYKSLPKIIEIWNRINDSMYKAQRDFIGLIVKINVYQFLANALITLLAYIIIAGMYFDGEIMLSEFTVVFLSVNTITTALSAMLEDFSSIMVTHDFMDEVMDVLEDTKPPRHQYKTVFNEIEFRNVWFKYNNSEEYSLENVNLKLTMDKTYAIVGENGSGKSTFIKLLLGVYAPTKGEILIDGVPSVCSRYDLFTTLSQDDHLYKTTLYDNFYKSSNINKVLSDLKLDKYIDKLNHQIGKEFSDDALEFSGGQEQKLLIARTLLDANKFMVLDEPTSNLDPETQSFFMEKILSNPNKAKFVVSHNLSILNRVEMILVFDSGSLDDIGSMEDLYSKNEKLFDQYNRYVKLYSG